MDLFWSFFHFICCDLLIANHLGQCFSNFNRRGGGVVSDVRLLGGWRWGSHNKNNPEKEKEMHRVRIINIMNE